METSSDAQLFRRQRGRLGAQDSYGEDPPKILRISECPDQAFGFVFLSQFPNVLELFGVDVVRARQPQLFSSVLTHNLEAFGYAKQINRPRTQRGSCAILIG
jgi:hypothetical protein